MPDPGQAATGAGGQAATATSTGTGGTTSTGGAGGAGDDVPCPTDAEDTRPHPGCFAEVDRICAQHTDERSCSGEPPILLPIGLVQCGWARVVTVDDPATCSLGAIGGRCYALTEAFLGCGDPCDDDFFTGTLLAKESESLVIELPCTLDGGELYGPIAEGMLEAGSDYPYYPCIVAEGFDPPAICDCVPQVCESK